VFTSPLCLAIAFYFAEKKNGRSVARKKINLLAGKIQVTSLDKQAVKKTISNKSILDFEDGLEYYSAVHSKCCCIITSDIKDFYFSEIKVLNAHDFLISHVAGKKALENYSGSLEELTGKNEKVNV
jgi:hypothetical protein